MVISKLVMHFVDRQDNQYMIYNHSITEFYTGFVWTSVLPSLVNSKIYVLLKK